jgi:hypothetical protein
MIKTILTALSLTPAAPKPPLTAEQIEQAAHGMATFAADLRAGNQLAIDLLDDGETPFTAEGWAEWPTSESRLEYATDGTA